MERPGFRPPGTPAEQLDTPAFVVDLSALEHNIEVLHSFFRGQKAKVRPHVSSHRCPAIAHKQLAAGGTAGGISVITVGEAEVFAQQGISDIFVASEVVTPQKIGRLCALGRHNKITVAADAASNVRDLSEAAQHNKVTLNVVVDIHTRLERGGVAPGRPAVELAEIVTRSTSLHFSGFMTYEGVIASDDVESRRCIQQVLDTRQMVEKRGLSVEVVSAGGTHNYEIAGSMPGVTEVPAGSYALMDFRYSRSRPQFRSAAKVLATVISHPEPGVAILDTGQKGIGIDGSLPVVEGMPGVKLTRMAAEHGILALEGAAQAQVDLGGKIWLTPWDAANSINVYDYVNAVRDGKLEAVWDVSARGKYR